MSPGRRLAALMLVAALALPTLPAGAAPTWLPVQDLVAIDQSMEVTDLDVAPDGTVVMVGREVPSFRAVAWMRRPGKAWSAPVFVSDTDVANAAPAVGAPAVAMDANGNATAVWSRAISGVNRVQVVRRPIAGGWSEPSTLSEAGASASSATLDVDARGNALVAWVRSDGSHFRAQARYRPVGAGWEPVATLSDAGANGLLPAVALGPAGQAIVAWERASIVQVARRTAAGPWGGDTTVSDQTHIAGNPVVVIDRLGHTTLTWTRTLSDDATVWTARLPKGEQLWQERRQLSSAPGSAGLQEVVADPAGNVTVVWLFTEGSLGDPFIVQGRRRAISTGQWEDNVRDVSIEGPSLVNLDATVDSKGVVTALWRRDGVIEVARRTPGQTWDEPTGLSPNTGGPNPVAVGADGQGNVTAAWYYNDSGRRITQVRALDVAGPRARMPKPSNAFTLTPPRATWSGLDVWSPIDGYRVRYTSASPIGPFGSPVTWFGNTTQKTGTLQSASLGRTYCFSARATDAVGNTGAFTAERCTAMPLDDRALSSTAGWTDQTSPKAYRGTFTTAQNEGETLRSSIVATRRIALVATRCDGCGKVRVYLGNDLLKTVGLQSATTKRRQLIPIDSFGTRREGVVRIVTVNDKPVLIEGLGISAR